MYNSSYSKQLVQFCELTYQQYQAGPPSKNNGNVNLPSTFKQVASFTAPEFDLNRDKALYNHLPWKAITSSSDVHPLALTVDEVYFGFAATSASYNVIALRGTQSDFEWMMDADILQVPVPLPFYDYNFDNARAHAGFLLFYAFLHDQIINACNLFNTSLPCLVTGHSLGAALATLCAPGIRLHTGNTNVQLYNYASPRLVNPAFVGAYKQLITESYRIVNLADLIPVVIASDDSRVYEHVPEEWSFLNQSGTIGGNHALIGTDNYTDAVTKGIPTNSPRVYPVTGL